MYIFLLSVSKYVNIMIDSIIYILMDLLTHIKGHICPIILNNHLFTLLIYTLFCATGIHNICYIFT